MNKVVINLKMIMMSNNNTQELVVHLIDCLYQFICSNINIIIFPHKYKTYNLELFYIILIKNNDTLLY